MKLSILTMALATLLGVVCGSGWALLFPSSNPAYSFIHFIPLWVGLVLIGEALVMWNFTEKLWKLRTVLADITVGGIYLSLVITTIILQSPAVIPVWFSGIVFGAPSLGFLIYSLHQKARGAEGVRADDFVATVGNIGFR